MNFALARCQTYLQKSDSIETVPDTDGSIFSDLDAFELSNDVATNETNNSNATHFLPATGHSGKNFLHLEINQSVSRVHSTSCNTFFSTNEQNVIPTVVSSLSFAGFTSSAPTSVLASSQTHLS